MQQIADLYQDILMNGQKKENRTGVDTLSVFGRQMRFPVYDAFPLVTGKFTPFKLVASELLFFLRGQCDQPDAIEELHQDDNRIWDEWVQQDGGFGPIYGVQWRHWLGADVSAGRDQAELMHEQDQIAQLIHTLKTNPESRRLIVTAWQPCELGEMALPPCHVLFQLNCRRATPAAGYYAKKRGRPMPTWIVDLQLYQRSCDAFLGLPFNVASYALLLELLCHVAGDDYMPGEFVWTGGDVHLYENHVEQARAYLHRDHHPLPTLNIHPGARSIDGFTLSDFHLTGYQHSGKLAGVVAV